MTKVQRNSQGKIYVVNNKALIASSGGGTPSGTTDVPLTRISDDNGNEIGTWYMNFEDANGNLYKIVLLDAQYRNDTTSWTDVSGSVTNLPLYQNIKTSNVWQDKNTATFCTQKILDWCSANNSTSTACSHCRSKSFTIGGTTYYGQLPNLIELIGIGRHYNEFDALDTTASSYTSRSFSGSHSFWSSLQNTGGNAWKLQYSCVVGGATKYADAFTAPILEIPLS